MTWKIKNSEDVGVGRTKSATSSITNIWDPVNVAASTVSSTRDERKAATSKQRCCVQFVVLLVCMNLLVAFDIWGGKEMQSLKTKFMVHCQ